MATQHLTTTTSLCELFNESELCPGEISNILQTLDNNNTNNIFNVHVDDTIGQVTNNKNSTSYKTKKRKKPAKNTTSSSSLGLGSDEESDEGRAVLSPRKGVKRQNGSLSPSAISMEDGSGGGVGGSNKNGKLVSHIAVERNRRKQMNEHLAILRQLIPCFYVKKGDQASIVVGVIEYINELHQVLQSLESKKRRKIYTSEVGLSPRVASSPRFLVPQQHLIPLPLSQRKQHLSPMPLLNFPVSPGTPQSTSSFYKPVGQPQTKDVGNELVASSKSNSADVQVKFCGPNLELRTLSSKIAGQTVKILSAIEDQSLEILQLSINTAEETMLNTITIKIGIDCQLSAEELSQRIQQTFC